MRFAFTDDQLLFRDTVADLLAKECPPEAVRWAWADDTGRRPELWAALAEMGVVGLTVPEAHGGLGMDELDLLPLLTEAGRVAFPGPLVETTAVVAPLLAESAPGALAERWLPAIAAGDAVATVQLAGQPFVADAHVADLLVAQRDDRLVRGAGRSAPPHAAVLGRRRPSPVQRRLRPRRRRARRGGGGRTDGRATAPSIGAPPPPPPCCVGLAEQMVAMTVEYVLARRQFGVPIGSFQAVKHHLADAELKVSFARPDGLERRPTRSPTAAPTSSRDVSMAKCFASDAGRARRPQGPAVPRRHRLHDRARPALLAEAHVGPLGRLGRRRLAPPPGGPRPARHLTPSRGGRMVRRLVGRADPSRRTVRPARDRRAHPRTGRLRADDR